MSGTIRKSRPVKGQTSKGPIKGNIFYTNEGKKFYTFEVIPYAHIPEGELRFAPPKEIESWSDQNVLARSKEIGLGGDNVLLLQIHTPEIKDPFSPQKFTRPVIVFVPNEMEKYTHKLFEFYGPQHLMNQDVVLVKISYRLGLWGYLKFKNSKANAPGNVGLRDIRAAFRFIRNEIENFGGCPQNITAYGQGCGATYLRNLIKSPLFEKCFDKAILGSYVDIKIDEFLFQDGSFIGRSVAEYLGFTGPLNDDIACVNYLRNLSVSTLRHKEEMIITKNINEVIHQNDIEPLMSEVYQVKIPLLVGYNSEEGLLVNAVSCIPSYENSLLERFCKRHGEKVGQTENLLANLEKILKKFYLPDKQGRTVDLSHDCADIKFTSEMPTDLMYLVRFMTITRRIVEAMSPRNVYLYRFNYNSMNDAGRKLELLGPNPGANHGDEVGSIFKYPNMPTLKKESNMYKVVKIMTTIWTQFAKTGNPNPPEPNEYLTEKWEPIQSQLSHCMSISSNGAKFEEIPIAEQERMKFWEDIFGVQFFSTPIIKMEKKKKGTKEKDA